VYGWLHGDDVYDVYDDDDVYDDVDDVYNNDDEYDVDDDDDVYNNDDVYDVDDVYDDDDVYDVDGWLHGYYGSFLISIFYLYSFSSMMIIMNPNHLYINHISIINLSSSVYYFQSSSIYLIIIPLSIIFISNMVVNTFRLLHLVLRVRTYILLGTPFNCRRHHDFFT